MQVELDCYDGTSSGVLRSITQGAGDGGPIVMHGGTLTHAVSFADCIAAIAAAAFTASELPVIITLENHCGPAGQAAIAATLRSVFGERLYLPPGLPGTLREWPSPDALRGKVLIRDKPVQISEETREEKGAEGGGGDGGGGEAADAAGADGGGDGGGSSSPTRHTSVVLNVAPLVCDALLQLVAIANVTFHSFERNAALEVVTSSSLSEDKLGKLLAAGRPALAAAAVYASRHLGRVYPAGRRVDSSNYDPFPAWRAGMQARKGSIRGRVLQQHSLPTSRSAHVNGQVPMFKPLTSAS